MARERHEIYDPPNTSKERGMTPETVDSEGRTNAAPSGTTPPSIDVIICAYTRDREALLRRAIASVVADGEPVRVIVVIDHGPELLAALRDGPDLGPGVEVYENEDAQGLSGARNSGLRRATADVVAFLDDDAVAAPGWLGAIRAAHADASVIGTGGWIAPEWERGSAPAWFPDEFLWTVGCSYRGMPTEAGSEIRNPIGANMSFRRAELEAVGGFRTGLGRVGTTPLGCEETEAAILMRAQVPGGRIVALPSARVEHFVPASRGTWSYFARRCVAEGRSKAQVTGSVGSADGLSSERRYVTVALPAAVAGGVRDLVRGDIHGLQRSAAVIGGLGLTTYGYVAARVAGGTGDGPDAPSASAPGRGLGRIAAAGAATVAALGAGHIWWHHIRGRR
jgi:GT2 family glycosyltransferase